MSAAKSSPVAGTRQPLTDNYRASRSDGPVSRTAVKPYGPGKPPNNQRHRGMVIPAWWVTHPHPLQHGMEMVGWSFPATQNTCSLNFISKTNTHTHSLLRKSFMSSLASKSKPVLCWSLLNRLESTLYLDKLLWCSFKKNNKTKSLLDTIASYNGYGRKMN